MVELLCGCRLWFLSADNPTSIRGRGFRKLKIDEGAWISESTYENAILPTLADSDGPLLIITTPAGRRGWVFKEHARASRTPPEAGYAFLQRPSWDLLDLERGGDPAYLEKLPVRERNILAYCFRQRGRVGRMAFDQEHGALFTEDAAALFKGIDACLGGSREKPQPEVQYVVGVDLGKTIGRTAAEVLRLTGGPPYQLADEEVMFEMEWPKQERALAAIGKKWNNAPLVVDATGVGGPVVDALREMGARVRPITITGGRQVSERETTVRKVDLLDSLAVAIGARDLRIPPELGGPDGDLRRELESFATSIDDEGAVTYESRAGYGLGHGDRAIALALAWHGAPRRGVKTISVSMSSPGGEEGEDDGGEDYSRMGN